MQESDKIEEHSSVFRRNIFLILLVNLVVKPIYILGIDAQVQNAVGENDYGLFFGLFTFCMLFQIILDPGIQNYNSQRVAKNESKVASYFSQTMASKLFLAALFILIVPLFGWVLGFESHHINLLIWVMLILILLSFMNYLRSHFSALGKYKQESWFSGLDKFLMILLIGYFLYVDQNINIKLFAQLQTIALLASCFIFLYFLSREFKLGLNFSFDHTRSLVRKTAPYALVLMLMTIYTRLDGIMLERLLDDNAYSAGVYAAGYRLLDAANMIGILFAVLMLPMFSKLIDQKEELNPLVEEVTQILFSIALLVVLISWFYYEPIMNTIYTNNTVEHYTVFRHLMLGFFAMGLANIFGCLFLAKNRLKEINLVFLAGIFINFVLNWLWIPQMGAFGATKATLYTQYFVFIGQVLLAFRIIGIKFSWRSCLYALLLILAGYFLFKFFMDGLNTYWLVKCAASIFLYLLLSFLLGFLRSPFDLIKTK